MLFIIDHLNSELIFIDVRSVETSNGIKQQESGQLKSVAGAGSPVIVATGSYTYPNPDGSGPIQLQYVADELGFRPVARHLPVSVQA